MISAIVNAIAIIAGAVLGLFLKRGIPERVSKAVMTAMGLCVVYIGIDAFVVGIGILNSDTNKRSIHHFFKQDGIGDDILFLIQIAQEIRQTAAEAIFKYPRIGILDALIGKDKADALVQIGKLTDTSANGIGIKIICVCHDVCK